MPKIGFKRLSRGVKLLTSHIHSQIGEALTRVTSTGVAPENLENGKGVTRLSFSWPLWRNDGLAAPPSCSSTFILPPPQEIFRSDLIAYPQDPVYILDTISFSFDSRAESAAIVDNAGADLSFSGSTDVAFGLSISERAISPSLAEPANTVVSIEYPNLGFISDQVRTNPQVREQLGVQFSPYKAYTLKVEASDLLTAASYMVASVLVTMTFRSEMRRRDSGSADVQNIPEGPDLPAASRYGAPYTNPQTVLTPLATAQIVASPTVTDDGVQGALEKIDVSVRSGLLGGYTETSRRHGYESLLNDAAYEVIAVPMWGNGWFVGNSAISNHALLPYVGAAFDQQVVDRRIIPLHFPMVIHHVIAFVNYQGGSRPTTATYSYSLGVGIGTGIRSDSNGYRQVAYDTWSNVNYGTNLLDASLNGDTRSVPIVGTGGVGFTTNGKPMYVGKTSNSDAVRSPAASATLGPPVAIGSIDGKEQWLEIRMAFGDSAGINNLLLGQTLVGHGGHWVYIIGKKQVC